MLEVKFIDFIMYVVVFAKITVYGKKSFLNKESDTLNSYRVYISPTM